MEPTVIVEVMVAAGFFTAVSETFRWFFNRPKARIDDAKIVQGMAVDLLRPLHEELNRVNAEVVTLRGNVQEAVQWMLAVRDIMDRNRIEYPDFPSELVG